jgi:hypothetical protein
LIQICKILCRARCDQLWGHLQVSYFTLTVIQAAQLKVIITLGVGGYNE